jgi:hypothetical protein
LAPDLFVVPGVSRPGTAFSPTLSRTKLLDYAALKTTDAHQPNNWRGLADGNTLRAEIHERSWAVYEAVVSQDSGDLGVPQMGEQN